MKKQSDPPQRGKENEPAQPIRLTFEKSLLSDDPAVRAEQYQEAMRFIDKFEEGYGSRCFVEYGDDMITVSEREGEDAGEVIEYVSGRKKREVQKHRAIIDEYETRYYEECFGRQQGQQPGARRERLGESFRLADTPEARYALYAGAVRLVEAFENQHSPKLTMYDDDCVKTTYWDDEHGERHYEHEDMPLEEKEALDDAWDVVETYERHYHDEWNGGPTGIESPGEAQEVAGEEKITREHNSAAPKKTKPFGKLLARAAALPDPEKIMRDIREKLYIRSVLRDKKAEREGRDAGRRAEESIRNVRERRQHETGRLEAFNRLQELGRDKGDHTVTRDRLEAAYGRMARFELQDSPSLTIKAGSTRVIASIDAEGRITRTFQPIEAGELRELDAAIASISEIAKIDPDLAEEMEDSVFGEATERIGEASPDNMRSIETLRYVTELEDSVGKVFGSYAEAIEWEQREFWDDMAPDPPATRELTDAQMEYIMGVEERAGTEFDSVEEAAAWEDEHYEGGDLDEPER